MKFQNKYITHFLLPASILVHLFKINKRYKQNKYFKLPIKKQNSVKIQPMTVNIVLKNH